MNKLTTAKRAQILGCLVEGMSIRATVRITGAAKNTVVKLLADVGQACVEYQDAVMTNLPTTRVECDEIWSYSYAKQRNVPEEHRGTFGYGDVWTWVAIDADTKLVPSFLVGERTMEDGMVFLMDLRGRLANRVQLTTDGQRAYLQATRVFQGDVDFAQILKIYTSPDRGEERRYSPAVCTGVEVHVRSGNPDRDLISTSYVERQNLTMRMGMRRFTRLTNGFSKKVENLAHAVALHFMQYNFCRLHQSLDKRTTPAMAAGITDHVWSLAEIVALLDRTPVHSLSGTE